MKILLSGSSGLIGSALQPVLSKDGHEVVRLVRREPASAETEIGWDPDGGRLDPHDLEGFDAIVHLAGENIAGGRWTAERKARIRNSRVQGTRLLCESLRQLDSPPQMLLCASAVGYYGDRGETLLDEGSGPGDNFLASVCQEWEAACDPAREKGIRVVNLRTGIVLSQRGGALSQMLLPFKMGVGGVVGDGRQYWSWIDLDDEVGAILHILKQDTLEGPVNATAPQPVTNREFTKILGRVLGRPTVLPLPAFAARLALGQMADELLLASTRVVPGRLQETEYTFQYADLEHSLRHVLGRS